MTIVSEPVSDLPFTTAGDVPDNAVRTGVVSLAGRTYVMDPTKGFVRQTLEMRKASQDQGGTTGQQSLTDAGLWHRSQIDWTLGAGQKHFDRPDSSDRRFWKSRGVDPWEPGELTLLNATTRVFTTSEGNLHPLAVGGFVYFTAGATLRRTSDLSSFASLATSARPKAITTDGAYVYVISDGGVDRTLVGSGAIAQFSAFSGDTIAYANGRLIAADGARLVEIDSAGTAGGTGVLDFTHPNPSFQWDAICSAPNAIYAAGHAGDRAMIYAVGVNTNTGGLRVPTFAAAVPDGEIVNALCEYGALISVGTTRGVREAQITGNSAVSIGPVTEIPGGVSCFEPQGEYVWFGWSNYDSVSTGLGRLGLAELTAPLVPAYASDLMAATQGKVVGVATFRDARVFTVEGSGLWIEQVGVPVDSGYLDAGELAWSTFARKSAAAFDVRHAPLTGTVEAYVSDENGVQHPVGRSGAASSLGPSAPFEVTGVHGEAINPAVVLRAANNVPPRLRRWTLSAVVRPQRQDMFILPLMFFSNLKARYGVGRAFDVAAEDRFIKSLEATGQVVTMQFGDDTYRVQIDQITQQEPTDWTANLDALEGIRLVRVITQRPGI